MRTLKSIITVAGSLKNVNLSVEEERLMLRAIREVNNPKLVGNDVILFDNILKDLFVGVQAHFDNIQKFIQSAVDVCSEQGLQPSQNMLEKMV